MKAHPYAELFPLIPYSTPAFDALVTDIEEHGQRDPIVLFDGLILDGRNRWRACEAAKIEPKTKVFRGDEKSALAFVLSTNLHRRHLDESQRAMVAARIATLGHGQRKDPEMQNCISRDSAAEQCNVGTRSVASAAAVISKGSTDLVRAVDAGDIPVSIAAKLLDKPVEEQRAIVAKVEAGSKPADAVRDVKRETVKATLEDVGAREAKAAAGVYDVIVIDPPWPMEKIERDERPNQVAFDYPTMSVSELAELKLACADDCHVWVWTTQKFLETALWLLPLWGLKFVCQFVWHKPGRPSRGRLERDRLRASLARGHARSCLSAARRRRQRAARAGRSVGGRVSLAGGAGLRRE